MTATATQPATVSIRFFEKEHLPKAIAVEQKSHEFTDPDFGVPQVREWAWDEGDFRSAIRQYRNKAKATQDTRAWVAERTNEVVGALFYETHDDHYEVILLSAADDDARRAMLDHVFAKADKSETRKRVTMVVPDGDYKTLKALMNYARKFQVTPLRNYNPGGLHTWLCVHEPQAAAVPVGAK